MYSGWPCKPSASLETSSPVPGLLNDCIAYWPSVLGALPVPGPAENVLIRADTAEATAAPTAAIAPIATERVVTSRNRLVLKVIRSAPVVDKADHGRPAIAVLSVPPAGLEPAISSVKGRRPNH